MKEINMEAIKRVSAAKKGPESLNQERAVGKESDET